MVFFQITEFSTTVSSELSKVHMTSSGKHHKSMSSLSHVVWLPDFVCHVVWSPVYVQLVSRGLVTSLCPACVTWSGHQSMSSLCHMVWSSVYVQLVSQLVISLRQLVSHGLVTSLCPACVTWSGLSSLCHMVWSSVYV